MMVKICGITEPADALAAAGLGASAIGFNFYPRSPRAVTPERAREIGGQLPAGVWKVGIFVDEAARTVERIAREASLDIVQLYGGEMPASLRVWRALRVTGDPGEAAAARENNVEAILLDSPAPGSGSAWAWELARAFPPPVVLAGGLDASNVGRAIEMARPWGVDACSRLESSPGHKDHRKMEEFIRAARFSAALLGAACFSAVRFSASLP